MGKIRQIEVIPSTELDASGGTTPSVTSKKQEIGNHNFKFPVGLYLINDGDSEDLDVTYDIGYMIPRKDSDTIQWDDTGNAITSLTTVNKPSGGQYGSQSLDTMQYIRFVVTNADTGDAATVRLIMFIQV